jgi:hypothetical protein
MTTDRLPTDRKRLGGLVKALEEDRFLPGC